MPPKHTVDQHNQGVLLSLPREGNAIAGGAVVDVEGAFFPLPDAYVPPLEAPVINLELGEKVARLQAEHHALNSLALENRSQGNITSNSNKATRIAHGTPASPEEQATPLESLSESTSGSEDAKDGLRLASKGSLAEALGIKAYTKTTYKTDATGELVRDKKDKLKVENVAIVTKDPSEQDRLDAEYRKFRMIYSGTRNRHRLKTRRKQIEDEIEALQPLTSAA